MVLLGAAVAAETEVSDVLTLVGRTGAPPAAVLDAPELVGSRQRLLVAQSWPEGQQPPPTEAGQAVRPALQVEETGVACVVSAALTLVSLVPGTGAIMTVVGCVIVVMPPLALCVTVTVVVYPEVNTLVTATGGTCVVSASVELDTVPPIPCVTVVVGSVTTVVAVP